MVRILMERQEVVDKIITFKEAVKHILSRTDSEIDNDMDNEELESLYKAIWGERIEIEYDGFQKGEI